MPPHVASRRPGLQARPFTWQRFRKDGTVIALPYALMPNAHVSKDSEPMAGGCSLSAKSPAAEVHSMPQTPQTWTLQTPTTHAAFSKSHTPQHITAPGTTDISPKTLAVDKLNPEARFSAWFGHTANCLNPNRTCDALLNLPLCQTGVDIRPQLPHKFPRHPNGRPLTNRRP